MPAWLSQSQSGTPSSRNKRNGRLRIGKGETKLSFSKDVYNIRGFSKMVGYETPMRWRWLHFNTPATNSPQTPGIDIAPRSTSLANIFPIEQIGFFNTQTLQNIRISEHILSTTDRTSETCAEVLKGKLHVNKGNVAPREAMLLHMQQLFTCNNVNCLTPGRCVSSTLTLTRWVVTYRLLF